MATEPARPELVLRDGRDYNSERPAYRKKERKKKEIPSDRAIGGESILIELYKYDHSHSKCTV